MSYKLGTDVIIEGRFTNASGVLADPTVVKVSTIDPEGNSVTKTYGSDLEVTKSSTGVYQYTVDANKHGEWLYRWFSTGTGKAAEEGSFEVDESQFVSA